MHATTAYVKTCPPMSWWASHHLSSQCRQDIGQYARLVAGARTAKEELSCSPQAWAEVPDRPGSAASWHRVPVRRADFEQACEHLVARAWAALAELGMQCKLSWLR